MLVAIHRLRKFFCLCVFVRRQAWVIELNFPDYNGFGGADNLLKLLSHKAVMLAWFEYISVDVQTYVSFQETPILRVLTWSSVKQGLCIQTAELEPPPNPL